MFWRHPCHWMRSTKDSSGGTVCSAVLTAFKRPTCKGFVVCPSLFLLSCMQTNTLQSHVAVLQIIVSIFTCKVDKVEFLWEALAGWWRERPPPDHTLGGVTRNTSNVILHTSPHLDPRLVILFTNSIFHSHQPDFLPCHELLKCIRITFSRNESDTRHCPVTYLHDVRTIEMYELQGCSDHKSDSCVMSLRMLRLEPWPPLCLHACHLPFVQETFIASQTLTHKDKHHFLHY